MIKVNEKETLDWFERGDWLKDLKFQPHHSLNKLEFARQFDKYSLRWDLAFAFLNNTDLLSLEAGNYEIDGEDIFAIVAEADKKEFEETRWESHRKYSDIQMVISGKEKIGLTHISSLKIEEPYNESKDIIFYSGTGDCHLAEPGTFFIFFPEDAHRPDIKVEEFDTDKKIVIKIKTI